MSERTVITKLQARSGLRAKLVRAMVLTLVVVTGATVLTVGYMNYRSARATLDTIETHIRQSIARKGQGLVANHALALRSLVADNAFGDVARLVDRSVHEDDEMLYGVFVAADGKVWTYAPSPALGAHPDFNALGIDPGAAARSGADSSKRNVAGQEAFEFSASVTAEDDAVLGRIFYGLSSVPLERALSAARTEFQRTLLLTLVLLSLLGVVATLLGIAIIRGVAARITRPLAHLTEVTTAIAGGRKDQRVSIASIGTDDEIAVLGSAFNQMVQELDSSYKDLESLNRTLEQRVEHRTRELGQRNRDMRLVLDNVNQGFLTMSRNGVLAEERSAIVTRWFGPSTPSQTFAGYVGRRDRNFAEAFELGWEVLMEGLLPLEVCLAQLPKHLRLDDRELEFSYHVIQEHGSTTMTLVDGLPRGLLIVINDITDQVTHARQEADRTELLAMVQGFMTDRSGFLAFFDEVTHLLETYDDPDSDVVTRKRVLHTDQGQRRPGRLPRGRRSVPPRRRAAGRRRRRRGGRDVAGAARALADVEHGAGHLARRTRPRRRRGAGQRARQADRRASRGGCARPHHDPDVGLAARAGRAPARAPGPLRPVAGAAPRQG
jgi:HAMP domain-containing protein